MVVLGIRIDTVPNAIDLVIYNPDILHVFCLSFVLCGILGYCPI